MAAIFKGSVVEVFEAEYRENMNMDAAILLGMDALYRAAEGKFDASTLEVGVVSLQDKKFRKLVPEEVENYVQQILAKYRETERKE